MFTFLKSNNPSVAALNLLLIVLFRIGFLLHPTDLSYLYKHTEPASQWLFRTCHIDGSTDLLWLTIAGGVLCFVESLLINRIINRHKVTTRKNFMGGLLFVLFSSLLPGCMVLSPVLIAMLFLLIATDKVFELGKPEKLLTDIFDLGFLSALAMFFYFPAVYLIVFVLMGFFIMRTTSIQGLLLIMTGFIAILAVVGTIYFWYDELHRWVPDIVNIKNRIAFSSIHISYWERGILLWLTLAALCVGAMMPAVLFSTVIQTRKYITILVVGGLLSMVAIVMMFNFNLSHLLFVAMPLSILYTVFFVETKMRRMPFILFSLLILSVLAFVYLPIFISV